MHQFKTATTQAAHLISVLVNKGYRGESSKKGWTTEADLLGGQRTDEQKIEEMIQAPDSIIELALDSQDRILGCVYLRKETPATLYLGMLTVDPEKQAQGLGKALLFHAEKICHQWGCQEIRMTVIEQRKELISFYQRRGYDLTGRTEPFPQEDPRFGLPKVEGLRFVELMKSI